MPSKSGPGRSHRTELTIMELFAMFPDDAAAEKWFEQQRWSADRSPLPIMWLPRHL